MDSNVASHASLSSLFSLTSSSSLPITPSNSLMDSFMLYLRFFNSLRLKEEYLLPRFCSSKTAWPLNMPTIFSHFSTSSFETFNDCFKEARTLWDSFEPSDLKASYASCAKSRLCIACESLNVASFMLTPCSSNLFLSCVSIIIRSKSRSSCSSMASFFWFAASSA